MSSPIAKIYGHMLALLTRHADTAALHASRLSAIENRLAQIDEGDDSAAAVSNALIAANARRSDNGSEQLACHISAGGVVIWTGKARIE